MGTNRYTQMSQADKAVLWEINEKRETRCMVEPQSNQYWIRPERRHFPHHSKSVLSQTCPLSAESRSTWATITPRHREKRHFSDQSICKGHLV
ncbi:hypothetical protein FKM82_017710 [Ascaphus truei]